MTCVNFGVVKNDVRHAQRLKCGRRTWSQLHARVRDGPQDVGRARVAVVGREQRARLRVVLARVLTEEHLHASAAHTCRHRDHVQVHRTCCRRLWHLVAELNSNKNTHAKQHLAHVAREGNLPSC